MLGTSAVLHRLCRGRVDILLHSNPSSELDCRTVCHASRLANRQIARLLWGSSRLLVLISPLR
jgi:hypothetical protein